LDITHGPIPNLLDERLPRRGMSAHEPGADLEALLFSGFTRAKDAFDATGISRKIFFHEHVDALLHRVFQVGRAEGGVPLRG
jgi:hypothetical protein